MLLQMLLQIALQSIISRRLGADQAVDAYEAATAIPLVIASMITLPLAAVLIPLVTRTNERSGEQAAWTTASSVAIVVFAGTMALAALLLSIRTALLRSMYSMSLAELTIASDVMRLAVWLIPANAAIAFSQGLHHWRNRFTLPALAGVIGPAVTLWLVGTAAQAITVQSLVQALLAGALVNAAIQLLPLIFKLRPTCSPVVLTTAARLTGPVLVGTIYWKIDPLIDRSIGSAFDEGTIASLGYCTRVTNAMAALASGGLSVVAFPRMSLAAARGKDELARETSAAVGASLLILVPLATAWFLFGDFIIRDLFEGGRFTPADTSRVALFVRCAIGVVVGGSLGEILGRTFFAQHDTLTPTLIGTACITAGFALKWAFSRMWGPAGVLVASSLAMVASALLQFFILRGRLGRNMRTFLFSEGILAATATALACGAGWLVLQTTIPFPSLAGGATGLAIYLSALYFLRRRYVPAPV